MDPKDLKLPKIQGEVAGLPGGVDRIWRILWSVDPAHLDPRAIGILTQNNIEYRAKLARLDAQASQIEAEQFEKILKEFAAKR